MKIVYIAGCTHSGSTLLNMVLGAHPDMITVGSLKKINRMLAGETRCACGVTSLYDCEFWGRVDRALRDQGIDGLGALNIRTRDRERFAEDNLALFSAVSVASGTDIIIDCSRKANRLRWLQEMPELEVIPIHLYKSPRNQASSWKRKGKKFFGYLSEYWGRNLFVMNACARNPESMRVSYEYFCEHTEQEVRRLCAGIGVGYDERMLDSWAENVIHSLGGNRRTKGEKSSRIELRERQDLLNGFEYTWVQHLCAPLWNRLEAR